MEINKIGLALLFTSSLVAGDNVSDMLKNGKVSGDLKAFYFNGDRDNREDRVAFAIGGILKYETADYNGLKFGTSFFSSHSLGLNSDNKEAGNTDLLQDDGSSIDVLGEAYLQYTQGKTTIKVGRQRLATPLANDYYNRFLPNSFEALVLINKNLPNTTLIGAYVTKWKYKDSEKFKGMLSGVGLDKNIQMLSAIYTGIPNTKIQVFDYYIPDTLNAFYFQANNKNLFDLGNNFKLCGAIQYLNEVDVGDNLAGKIDTNMFGFKLGLSKDNFKLTALYSKIGDGNLLGTGNGYSKLGWSKFLPFTDIQIDGETENNGAEAMGFVLAYNWSGLGLKDLKTYFKYVTIDQDTTKNVSRGDSNEWNIDIKYKINPKNKIRVRYANINYDNYIQASNGKNREYDEDNLRVIYDFKF